MGLDTIYDNAKKFKFLFFLYCLTMVSGLVYCQTSPQRTNEVFERELRENAIAIRENWISRSYNPGDVIPQYPMPARSGYMVPSVDDMVRILSLANPSTADSVLVCGPLAGYLGLVLAASGVPVWIVEYGDIEREYLSEYAQGNEAANVHVADNSDLEFFKGIKTFNTVIITYGIQDIGDVLMSQLSDGKGTVIAPLSNEFGSQLLTVIEKDKDTVAISVKGRTWLANKN